MKIKLAENMRGIVEKWAEHDSVHLRNRASIILLTADGKTPEEISSELQLGLRTVSKWLELWQKLGLRIFHESDEDVAIVDGLVVHVPAISSFEDERIPVEAGDTMAEAGRKVLLHDITAMRFYEEPARTGFHSEGVHKMRVATRRLRSAHKAFRPYLDATYYEQITKPLRHTAQSLGAVRDLDVFLIKTQPYVNENLEGEEEALLPLLMQIREEYTSVRQTLTQWLDSRTYQKFAGHFQAVLQYPVPEEHLLLTPSMGLLVRHVIPEMIYARFGAVRRFELRIHDADLNTLHRLRIEFKRLRYTLEFFETVLGDEIGGVIKEIKALQEILGDLNDAVVAGHLIHRLYKNIPKKERDGVKAYREYRHEEIAALVEQFLPRWEHFNRPDLRQTMANAVARL
ncbi:MAG: CHAD domain-containing protein [Anaerolineae bacterium]|nr:CHAD domain-containing protein [Anaerolineae bacterium]